MFPKRAAHPTVDGVLLGLMGHIILISGTVMLRCSFTNSNGLVMIYIPLTRQIQPFMLNICFASYSSSCIHFGYLKHCYAFIITEIAYIYISHITCLTMC